MKKIALALASFTLSTWSQGAFAVVPATTATSVESAQAVTGLRELAERGDTTAMQDLAHRLVRGQGVSQDLYEAETWFRRSTTRPDAPTPTISPLGKPHCKQAKPDWPRDTPVEANSGAVGAALFVVDGVLRDVLIYSGPKAFHETVRKTFKRYECENLAGFTGLLDQEFVFADASYEDYVVRPAQPNFVGRPPLFSANWHSLSKEQQASLRAQTGIALEQDEPPFPMEGLGQLHEYFRQLAQRISVHGRLQLSARVGVDGKVESIAIPHSPSAEFSKYAAAVVYNSAFKAAVCSGSPCAKDFSIDLTIYRAPPIVGRPKNWWFTTLANAAESGDAQSQNEMGRFYQSGKEVNRDRVMAMGWYQRAAQQGLAVAQYNLGALYENGTDSEQNWPAAVNWYRLSAQQGYAYAQYALGSMLEQGHGTPRDVGKAIELYRAAAVQGHILAQTNLARAYTQGVGVKADLNQAAYWLRQSAQNGYAPAQAALGVVLMHGRGVEPNPSEAVQWYQKAAAQGHAVGQNNLADAYENGRGVPKDLELALKWYRLAADQKLGAALYSLSLMYADGRGVEQDATATLRLLKEAAAVNFKPAITKLLETEAAPK